MILIVLHTLTSCMTLTHVVGEGARSNVEEKKKEWYMLFGLVPISFTDSKEMASGASNYTIKTEITFFDVLTNLILFPLTITSQTVTVIR